MQLGSGITVAVAKAGSCSSNLTPSWKLSYATGVALKRKKKEKEKACSYRNSTEARVGTESGGR